MNNFKINDWITVLDKSGQEEITFQITKIDETRRVITNYSDQKKDIGWMEMPEKWRKATAVEIDFAKSGYIDSVIINDKSYYIFDDAPLPENNKDKPAKITLCKKCKHLAVRWLETIFFGKEHGWRCWRGLLGNTRIDLNYILNGKSHFSKDKHAWCDMILGSPELYSCIYEPKEVLVGEKINKEDIKKTPITDEEVVDTDWDDLVKKLTR